MRAFVMLGGTAVGMDASPWSCLDFWILSRIYVTKQVMSMLWVAVAVAATTSSLPNVVLMLVDELGTVRPHPYTHTQPHSVSHCHPPPPPTHTHTHTAGASTAAAAQGDVPWYDTQLHAPTIKALGEGGLRLGHQYAWHWCAPTRGALMSGRLPMHSGYADSPSLSAGLIGMAGCGANLDLRLPLLPLELKAANYSTHMLGKCKCNRADPTPPPHHPTVF
jgi:arylsulfatase A-like enzyme